MSLLLAVAILGQPVERMPAAVEERGFCWAVEEFCEVPLASVPAPYRDLFRRMGDRDWRERHRATLDAARAVLDSPGDDRWLMAGRRHPDPEVRHRCNAALRLASGCPACKGSGRSKNWSEWPCAECEGFGTTWTLGAFD